MTVPMTNNVLWDIKLSSMRRHGTVLQLRSQCTREFSFRTDRIGSDTDCSSHYFPNSGLVSETFEQAFLLRENRGKKLLWMAHDRVLMSLLPACPKSITEPVSA